MTVHYDSHRERVEALISGECFEGMVDGAEYVLTEARVVVPHEEGDLERAGAVTPDRPADKVWISFDRPYATRQHEELTWRHKPGRKAKYLEDTANANQDTVLAIAAARGRRAFRGGA